MGVPGVAPWGGLGAPQTGGSRGSPPDKHCGPWRSRPAASMARRLGAPLGTLHIPAPHRGTFAHRCLVQPNKYWMQPISVNRVYINYIFPQPELLSRFLPADTVRAVTCAITHMPDQ